MASIIHFAIKLKNSIIKGKKYLKGKSAYRALLNSPRIPIGGVCSKKFEPISPKTDPPAERASKTRGAGGIPLGTRLLSPPRACLSTDREGDLFGLKNCQRT